MFNSPSGNSEPELSSGEVRELVDNILEDTTSPEKPSIWDKGSGTKAIADKQTLSARGVITPDPKWAEVFGSTAETEDALGESVTEENYGVYYNACSVTRFVMKKW